MKTTTITLPNGSTAIDFTPQDSKEKAIVHLHVIKRLAQLLPKTNPQAIIHELQEEIKDAFNAGSLQQAVDTCNEFSAFHETINLITAYDPLAIASIEAGLHPDD